MYCAVLSLYSNCPGVLSPFNPKSAIWIFSRGGGDFTVVVGEGVPSLSSVDIGDFDGSGVDIELSEGCRVAITGDEDGEGV